ncbi:hypothetical protein QE392_002664 [Microbacterium proteolyticum]|uniref:hypothetical protein n=2 Tax=Microbacterium TaxID=33882 RepID=UPI002781D9BF|nr:hypothetical protein [Microbacterium proteolyticum]MDQ1170860.1 hypothetical protein [Microbacterium proteolyticum]
MAASARLLSIDEQAAVAIAAGTGAFLAAIAGAATLEARLAEPRLAEKTYVPLWATLLGLLGGVLLALGEISPVFICIGLPACMVALQIGRLHAVNASAWKTELVAAAALSIALLVALLLLLSTSPLAYVPLGVGAAVAAASRSVGAPWRVAGRPATSTVIWITMETAVVAAIPYVTNFAILAFLGPADTVAFRLVLSTLGVLQPILGYVRVRLLGRHSKRLIVGCYGLSALALSSVLVLHFTGVLMLVYGEAWEPVTVAILLLASVWKLLTISETAPFASLRRRGSVRTVFTARFVSAVVNVTLTTTAAALSGTMVAVFAAFVLAQMVTIVLYTVMDSRDRRSRSEGDIQTQ